MSLAKSLRIPRGKKGQAALEYFVLFAIIAMLTLFSFSTFFPKVQRSMQGNGGVFEKAIATSGLNVNNN